MSIRERINEDIKDAMRARDELRKTTLRMALSALKLGEIDKREPLEENEMLAILQREVKARREAIADARKAERPDLIEHAEAEIQILSVYLPQEFSAEELTEIVRQTINEVGAASMNDMGKVMKAVMPKVRGRADGGEVNRIVRAVLSQN